MKSVLISCDYFPPQIGGISYFIAAVASALGPDRVCCLTAVRENGAARHDRRGPRVYRRPLAFARAKPIQAVGWGATIAEIMARERPQVVQLATAYEGYLGLWLRRRFRLPFVVYAHGNEILDVMQGGSDKPRLALRQADRVLANSRHTAHLVQQVGTHPDRIEIVHPGCDANRFRPRPPRMDLRRRLLGAHDHDRVILTVGNLVARKGHDTVIRALPSLCARIPDVTYLVVGDGPCRAQLETLAVATHVRNRVIFAGRVSDEDLPDIYALSDVFVMPSREQLEACDIEGFGLVFLEANACGKPVVGGRSGGVPEAVADGVTGLLVNPEDPEDVANALARLLSDRELATRLGQQGRARVVREFDWTRIGVRVQGILDSVRRGRHEA